MPWVVEVYQKGEYEDGVMTKGWKKAYSTADDQSISAGEKEGERGKYHAEHWLSLNPMEESTRIRYISGGYVEPTQETWGGDRETTRTPEEVAELQQKGAELASKNYEKLYGEEKAQQYLGDKYIPPEQRTLTTTKPQGEVMTKEEFEKLKEQETQKRFEETTAKIEEKKREELRKTQAKDYGPAVSSKELKTEITPEGYEIKRKETTTGGTVLASSIKRESELSLYEQSEYNKYLRGKQTYQEYVSKVEKKNKEYYRGELKEAAPPQKIEEQLMKKGEAAYQAGQREYPSGSRFKEAYYKTKGAAYMGVGAIITGVKNVGRYAKEHPIETVVTVGLILLPEDLSTLTGSARLAQIARVGVSGYFIYQGARYATSAITRIQTSPSPAMELATVSGEVGTTLVAFKVVKKIPAAVAAAKKVYTDARLSSQLSSKYKGALITKPSGELAEIIKDPSTKIQAKAILGYEGTYIKSTTTRGTIITEGQVKPIYSRAFYVEYAQLTKAPKDFIAAYQISRGGAVVPAARGGASFDLTTTRASTYKTTQTGRALTNIKEIQYYSKPYYYSSEFPSSSSLRWLEAGSLKVRLHGVELSKGKQIIDPKTQYKKYKKGKKGDLYEDTGDYFREGYEVGYTPKLEYKQPIINIFDKATGKGIAIFKRGYGRIEKVSYDAPLIIEKIKVKSKPKPKKSTSKGGIAPQDNVVYVEKDVGGLKIMQAVKVKTKAATKQETKQKSMQIKKPKLKTVTEQKQKTQQKSKIMTMQDLGAKFSHGRFAKVGEKLKSQSRSKSKAILKAQQKPSFAVKQAIKQMPRQETKQKPKLTIKSKQTTIRTPKDTTIPTTTLKPPVTYPPFYPPNRPPIHEPPARPPTTPPAIPPFKFPEWGRQMGRSKPSSLKVKQPKSYTPTAYSAIGGITGKPTAAGIKSGLGIRPIIKKKKKKFRLGVI